MPAGFEKCRREGGKIRTESHGDTYRHVCYLRGKRYPGELKHKQSPREDAASRLRK